MKSQPLSNQLTQASRFSEIKDATGRTYKVSIFFPQAQAALAKSVIFAAEAKIAIKRKQYLWASIAAYYSFFHLSICLMYVLPAFIEQNLLTKLVMKRQEGAVDPTELIKHSDIPKFLKICEEKGLSSKLCEQLRIAKELREFVNYKPRITWQHRQAIIFKTKEFTLQDIKQTVESLEPLLCESLSWASQQNHTSQLIAKVSAFSLDQFLNQDDLMYKKWCPKQVIAEAHKIRSRLLYTIKS